MAKNTLSRDVGPNDIISFTAKFVFFGASFIDLDDALESTEEMAATSAAENMEKC